MTNYVRYNIRNMEGTDTKEPFEIIKKPIYLLDVRFNEIF
jgi:hypothetical protein